MKQDDLRSSLPLYLLGLFPVIWLALLAAPHLHGGLPEILQNLAGR